MLFCDLIFFIACQDNVRRFKRAHYHFVRREDIAHCFGHFDRALPENRLWELSEKLKPRHGGGGTFMATTATAAAAGESNDQQHQQHPPT